MKNNNFIPPYVINDENPIMTLSQTVDWGLNRLNITELHKRGYTGKGIKVGVIDSGCDLSHRDLKIASFKDFTKSGEGDSSGHGTHVAGIIAAQGNEYGVLGVAPDVELHIYKALDGATGSMSSIGAALRAAIKDGMDIINMSLGSPKGTKVLENLCLEAEKKGIIIISASGNTGKEQDFYPATYESCIAVGAVDKNLEVAYFTTYGEQLDVMAPGAKILSTYKDNSYSVMSGTSMAAPFVSGCVALMMGAGIPITYETITKTVIDIEEENFDKKSGYGIFNPQQILLDNYTPEKLTGKKARSFSCNIFNIFKK